MIKNIYLHIKWWLQKRIRGYSDKDTWAVDMSICKYAIPLLKALQNKKTGVPIDYTRKEWDKRLSYMIGFCEWVISDERYNYWTVPKKVELGKQYFFDDFLHLWW